MNDKHLPSDYGQWIQSIKNRVGNVMREMFWDKAFVVGIVVAVLGAVLGGALLNFFFQQTDPGDAAQDIVSGMKESAADLKGELCSMKESLEHCEECVWVIQQRLTKKIPERTPSDILNEREANTYLALRKYKECDFGKAYAFAVRGDLANPDVQFIVGSMEFFGLGVAKSENEAFSMWQKAAFQGQSDAQYDLGIMYAQGEFVATNAVLAMHWLRAASSNGNARASYAIGNAFEHGRLGYRDYTLAIEWYTKAFGQGFVHAGYHLARLYDHKKSTVFDKAKAVEWYEKAADAGDVSAMHFWGGRLLGREPQRGVAMLERAFEKGAIDAGCNLYFEYRLGVNLDADEKKAEYWLKRIAESSPETAQSLKESFQNLDDDDCGEGADKREWTEDGER